MSFTIGADPELLLVAKDTKIPVPAIGLIGGTKHSPAMVKDGFGILEDNVAAEYVIPPSKTKKDFVARVTAGKMHIKKKLGDTPRVEISKAVSLRFRPQDLRHPLAQEFGCEPDYCAWTEEVNSPPRANQSLRSAGGHVHLGFDTSSLNTISVVRMMDVTLGVPSVLIDKDTERRKLYGKAGAFRPKAYGVEYRTLSSFWVHSKKLIEWVFENSKLALEMIAKNESDILSNGELGRAIISCINNSDRTLAKKLCSEYNIPLP